MRSRPAALLATLLLAMACARSGPTSPDVIIVTLDACRADRMGFLGNPRGLTPFLDGLAARAYVFDRAYTAAAYTTASIASLFTSRLPSRHGVTWFNTPLPAGETTLAEALAAHGYATGTFTGNLLFPGAKRGFEVFRVLSAANSAGGQTTQVLADAHAWAAPLPPPRFLYLHAMDTHAPYIPTAAALARVGQPPDPAFVMRVNEHVWLLGTRTPTDAELHEIVEVYDATVASADDGLATLASPAWQALVANAILVFTADHGEDFGERGHFGHGETMDERAIRVPLLIAMPGQSERVDVHEVVSLIDVAPTLLDLLDLPVPAGWEGRSLAPAMARAAHPRHPATWWSTWREGRAADAGAVIEMLGPAPGGRDILPRAAIVRGGHKAVAYYKGTRNYYDLAADPDERQPAALDAGERRPLDAALDQVIGRTLRAGDTIELDDATRARLRALGYITD